MNGKPKIVTSTMSLGQKLGFYLIGTLNFYLYV